MKEFLAFLCLSAVCAFSFLIVLALLRGILEDFGIVKGPTVIDIGWMKRK